MNAQHCSTPAFSYQLFLSDECPVFDFFGPHPILTIQNLQRIRTTDVQKDISPVVSALVLDRADSGAIIGLDDIHPSAPTPASVPASVQEMDRVSDPVSGQGAGGGLPIVEVRTDPGGRTGLEDLLDPLGLMALRDIMAPLDLLDLMDLVALLDIAENMDHTDLMDHPRTSKDRENQIRAPQIVSQIPTKIDGRKEFKFPIAVPLQLSLLRMLL